ncbi:RagB/SusD family nutrient uptake outer membrane protein [Flavobacterium sp. 9AF]|uniref:RagB/SusD family nutrient uptake outer membrane protein n=1 Tax=Flavobacterium sp. 9AF TaxID=2653142 RepID=UPI0012F1905E|nr:RagB/SusD family nutrient uptake outer membrane protein [Flavobacterium sp. 9AF]VXC26868.1 RagB/SusD family nutrient uptake outer membrane protein [Flavobacterium sp. 9AF]
MKRVKLLSLFILSSVLFSGCTDDLNTEPKVELSLEQLLQKDPNAITGIMSKLYGSFALSGPNGPGSSDISDDPGESPFLRGIINLQEFTADGMKNRWGDDGLDQLTTTSSWDENNKFFRYLYNRVYYTVPQCNNLLVVLNNVDVPNEESIVSEVRFLRSLAYYYMIDCFGKGVLVTEENVGESTPLPEASRLDLFNFVEAELLDIEDKIATTNSYGRANKAVVRMLLAKLYLNAQVYTGVDRYTDALTYTKKVIAEGGYTLNNNFAANFTGDNNTSNEIIYPLIADPLVSQSYGNTTYIVNGSLNSATMTLSTYGATQGWGGHRATKAWYGLFGNLGTSTDSRAQLFWTNGHTYEMTDYKEWMNGYPSIKFRNNNYMSSSASTDFSGTDFPLFRLADAYLMFAECVVRGASGGSMTEALDYVNQVRQRSNAPIITSSELNLDFLIDERGRELMLEGHRRSDLIRFGKFTGGSYLWPWKGNTLNGTAIPSTYNVFPIPLTALQANPNLSQNPGY